MKRSCSLLILLLLAFLYLPAFSQAAETESLPAAHFLETSYAFGTVVSGTYVTHSYVVRNAGTGTLEIQKVHTG
jgi:hypothetical protein